MAFLFTSREKTEEETEKKTPAVREIDELLAREEEDPARGRHAERDSRPRAGGERESGEMSAPPFHDGWGEGELRPHGQVITVDVRRIRPNPAQPRRRFDSEALLSLSESIRRHGILQPPPVRALPGGYYELIAGERRLRAAILAGMAEIPCLLTERRAEESAELAVIENLQRRDLDIFEEAAAIAALAREYGMTQEEIGRRLSVSQSYVANKLRLLRLSEEARAIFRDGGMTERHARAVLRLPEEGRIPALLRMKKESMNVAAAERYVERLLSRAEKKKPAPRRGVVKDIRFFYNSVDRASRLLEESGIDVASERVEYEDRIELRISIAKEKREENNENTAPVCSETPILA